MSVLSTINLIVFIVLSVLVVFVVLIRKHKGSGLSNMLGTSAANTVAASTIADRNLGRVFVTLSVLWTLSVCVQALIEASTF